MNKIDQINNPIHSNDRVYGGGGISPTLNSMQGGNRQPKILIPEATKQGYAVAKEGDSINLSVPNSKTRRGRVGKGVAQTLDTQTQQYTIVKETKIIKTQYGKHQQDAVHNPEGLMSCISPGTHGSGPHLTKTIIGTRIRRLTEVECERLQGFPDGWTEGIASTQRYKCLGNAVTVNVVQAIMEKLYPKGD